MMATEAETAAWLEDLQFLADNWVPFHEAAKRTGFETPDRLRRWLSNNHHSELLRRLTHNSHRRGMTSEGDPL